MTYICQPYANFLATAFDHSLLMISIWRSTSVSHSVRQRFCESLSKSGNLLLINFLAKICCTSIGLSASISSVRRFCIYLLFSLISSTIYQFTFYLAFLYYSGLREFQNRHCFTFCRLETPTKAGKNNKHGILANLTA